MTPLAQMAASHGVEVRRMRWLIMNGFALPGSSGIEPTRTRTFTLIPDERIADASERIIRDYPTITDRRQLEDFRETLIALDAKDAALCDARLCEAVDVLKRVPNLGDLREVVVGTTPHLSAFLTRLKAGAVQADGSEPVVFSAETNRSHLMTALSTSHEGVKVLVDFGLMTATKTGTAVYFDVPRDRILPTLLERFWTMPRAAFGMKRLNQYPRIRRLLGLAAEDRHPPALLEDVIDWLIGLHAIPEKTEVLSLIWGCKDQIHDALAARYRRGDPVVMPKRTVKRYEVTVEDLRAVVHPALKNAFRTALDPDRAHPTIVPRNVDMISVIENGHETLQQVAATVALAGWAMPRFSSLRIEANIVLRDLAGPMSGADPGNDADIQRVLQAQYILAMASKDAERRRLLSNVAHWPWVVTIFEAYRHQEGLPQATADYLETIAPAMPCGSDDVIGNARRELDLDDDRRYETRADELGDLLDNVASLYPEMERRRNETKGFRRRVMELHNKSVPWAATVEEHRVSGIHTITDETAPAGRQKRHVHFAIRSWPALANEVADAGGPSAAKSLATFWRHIPDCERALFENHFAVEYLGCWHEDGSAAEPPKWFGLFSSRVFWRTSELREGEVEDAFAVRKSLGVSTMMLRNLARGFGDFAGGKKSLVRHARRYLGMVLLPVDEWDHLEAVSLYAVSTKLDEPIRTSEHLQFNIGKGLDVHAGDDGVNYTVFRSWRKKKPLIHDFMISRESELLTEELLSTTSRRKYGGGPIPEVAKARQAGRRAAAFERYVLAYGNVTLDATRVDMAVVCMSWGIHSVGVVNFKYVWNKLAKERGMTLDQRREEQGHRRAATSKVYDPVTPKEREAERNNRRNAISERRERLLTERSAPERASGTLTSLAAEAAALKQAMGKTADGAARDALLREYAVVQARITTHHIGGRLAAKIHRTADDE